MITTSDFSSHEFIGCNVKIIGSTNSQIIGLNGVIVDETKSMFSIKTGKGLKNIPKENNRFEFSNEGGPIILNGKILAKRPFDRIGVKT